MEGWIEFVQFLSRCKIDVMDDHSISSLCDNYKLIERIKDKVNNLNPKQRELIEYIFANTESKQYRKE